MCASSLCVRLCAAFHVLLYIDHHRGWVKLLADIGAPFASEFTITTTTTNNNNSRNSIHHIRHNTHNMNRPAERINNSRNCSPYGCVPFPHLVYVCLGERRAPQELIPYPLHLLGFH